MGEKYLDRTATVEYLKETWGVHTSVGSLANLASNDKGPKYVIINGRALSTPKMLDDWVAAEAKRDVRTLRRGRAASATA